MDKNQFIGFIRSLYDPIEIAPDSLLWHYTDTQGLAGIVCNRTIRLSHPSFLNDPSELQYANSIYDEILEDMRSNAQDPLAQDFARRYLAYKMNYCKQYQEDEYSYVIFVTSFCEEQDRLELWRQYGDDGRGFALGFRMKELQDAAEKQVQKTNLSGWVRVLRVLYDIDEQYAYAKQILDFWLNEFKTNKEDRAARRNKYVDLDLDLLEVYSPLRIALDAVAPFFKHPCYENEKENRLVLNVSFIDPDKINFLARRGYFKPYIDFKVEDDENDAFPLDTVMLGPTTPPMWSERSLRMFLDNQRLKNAKLKRSDLPYRRP